MLARCENLGCGGKVKGSYVTLEGFVGVLIPKYTVVARRAYEAVRDTWNNRPANGNQSTPVSDFVNP